jgi:prolyl oligopeptidase
MAEPIALKYRAFISYSHADTSWAKWLHRGLEGFRIDKDLVGRETSTGIIPKTLRPIFRDRDDFTAGHMLSEQTLAALDASHALIVICSPASAKSHYVNEEIRLFKSRHPERPIIPVIVDGTPDGPHNECFSPALKFKVSPEGKITPTPEEPLAADVREDGDGKNLALAKVVAGLLGVSPDDIFRRAKHERRRRQQRWIAGLQHWIAGVSVVALALAGLSLQRGHAYWVKRDPVKAFADFDAALKIAPDNIYTLITHGGVLDEKGDFDGTNHLIALGVEPPIIYPKTARGDVVEEHFGERIADPYRWLENDVREDPHVRAWVTAQNDVTNAYLATLPGRAAFRARMTRMYDYERFGLPEEAGGRYFYTRNDGLQNQSVLYVRDGLSGTPRMLIDPNTWSQDGTMALAEWKPSEDGRHLLYSIQDGGTDWRTVRVLDVATGQPLADEIRWVKFSDLDWAKDGSGFFYSRFPEPAEGAQFQSLNENQTVYFHRLGAPQSEDRLAFSTPDHPRYNNTANVSEDGRWLIVSSSEGTDERYDITLIDLTAPDARPVHFVTGREHDWTYIGNRDNLFYWRTNSRATRQRIVVADITRPVAEAREIVPEDEATLESASIVGNQLIAEYLVDVKSEVRTFDLEGRRIGGVALPGIGSADGFRGDGSSSETFYSFSSYNTPATIYRYDSAIGQTSLFAQSELAFDPKNYEVHQVFFDSRDGTRVPMFLVQRKDLNRSRPQPTLLYGYGGFNSSQTPEFRPRWMTWVDMGGVLAVANIRGGGEYGQAWHDAGRRANKQNVFDDFIAAAEHLIREGVTSNRNLVIEGRSNGGLLVGAVINQRPDLFAAVLPGVGVMDMLRFDRFTAGRLWVDDYGYPDREADFRILRAYSPYHNIRSDMRYPAVLVTTADTDDRVVPGHSFKYIAALQAAETGPQPHLIRIETRAGHGSGKPTDKQINEFSDMYAFAAHFTGLVTSNHRSE